MLDLLETRMLNRLVVVVTLALMACDDGGGGPGAADVGTSGGSLEDGGIADVEDAYDAADVEEVEVLYPGHPCGGDDQCSTGLCYGIASSQGAFEQKKCQSLCLQEDDFNRYCDSDDDCCKGRCCIDCGPREGLCVLD